MFSHQFVLNALLAGSLIAPASGLVGWFLVTRRQVFAADALSHVAFTGALAAAAVAVDLRVGLFAATVLVALGIAALGVLGRGDDVEIGTVFVGVLGLGVLFLYLFSAGSAAGNGTIAARTLFGSIFALSLAEARLAAGIGAGVLACVLAIGRPLLLASLQGELAQARGLPVRALGLAFLALLGLDAAAATQAVGALLLLGLIAAPAGAAHRVTSSPYRGMTLAAAIALASTWLGIALSYWIPALPPGSAIALVCAACYASTVLV